MQECPLDLYPFRRLARPQTDSLSHHLDNDAFRALSVELGIINLLPGPEIEAPVGHRHNHLMMHHQALEMRVAIRLAGAMMPVVLAIRSQFYKHHRTGETKDRKSTRLNSSHT